MLKTDVLLTTKQFSVSANRDLVENLVMEVLGESREAQ